MSVSKYNEKGYPDPTAYEAICNIEREEKLKGFRPIVFVCSPFKGDLEKNTRRARRYSRFVVTSGGIPFAPHLLFPQFMDEEDSVQRELGIFFGTVFLRKCQELWVFGDKITSGMQIEIDKAKTRNILIRYFNERCEEVQDK
ncbi:MAG: DUF4406 domain-containing protein [Bacillota bacterium]